MVDSIPVEQSLWGPVGTGIPPSPVTLVPRIFMARLSMAAGRLQVPSLAHPFIPKRSIQDTGITHGHLAMAPGGVVLVISGAN